MYIPHPFFAGIVFQAYSPLGNPGSPLMTSSEPQLLQDPVIRKVAAKHNATAAQVISHENSRLKFFGSIT